MQGTRWGAYGASAILSILTLAVFYALRDYGPESALRRFHQATIDQDLQALQRVCKEDVESPAVQRLLQHVSTLIRQGARIRMGFVHRENRQERVGGQTTTIPSVITEVRYYTAQGVQNIFWVLDHDPGGWVVNASETLSFPARLGAGRPG